MNIYKASYFVFVAAFCCAWIFVVYGTSTDAQMRLRSDNATTVVCYENKAPVCTVEQKFSALVPVEEFVPELAAGVNGWKTDVIAAFTNNFTAGVRTTIAASFVSAYQGQWTARVAAGTVDNATNRGIFVADMIAAYVDAIVRSEQHKANVQALPTPTPLPN